MGPELDSAYPAAEDVGEVVGCVEGCVGHGPAYEWPDGLGWVQVGRLGREADGGAPVMLGPASLQPGHPAGVEDAPVVRQAAGGVVVVVGGWMPVELSCDVAFEAADDLASGHAFGGASLQVGPGAFVPAYSGLDDAVEGGVCLTVAAAVQSPSPGFAGRVPRRW